MHDGNERTRIGLEFVQHPNGTLPTIGPERGTKLAQGSSSSTTHDEPMPISSDKPVKSSIDALQTAYRSRETTPERVIQQIIDSASHLSAHNIWIEPPTPTLTAPYLERLTPGGLKTQPLWGVPFAIKDNIDLENIPTTAGCPAFSYVPDESAFAVAQLIEAGAIPVGKTNLDQFATGLVGTRSPYGYCTHPDRPDHISGGSSSGSAVAVSLGLASFALGTDTAGSGRVPAGLNGIFGLKPTRGLISTRGVVPACRTLDCVSIFANTVHDLAKVSPTLMSYDRGDAVAITNPFHNHPAHYGIWQDPLTLGILSPGQLDLSPEYVTAYAQTLDRLSRAEGLALKEVDYQPFAQAAAELYSGPWLAERFMVIEPLLNQDPSQLHEVTRAVVEGGKGFSAPDLFTSMYRLGELRRTCADALATCDALLTPTAKHHYLIQDLQADPIGPNTELGHFTNFMNLLDFCGLSLPGMEASTGAPFGITLVADRLHDARLLAMASRIDCILHETTPGVSKFMDPGWINVAVCGAHMEGLPLNGQLTDRGGRLRKKTQTAPCYKLYALSGGPPFRPGLVRCGTEGRGIELEVWQLPADTLADFMKLIPWPLAIGKVLLDSGEEVSGFVCEPAGTEGAVDITDFGGWRSYLDGGS